MYRSLLPVDRKACARPLNTAASTVFATVTTCMLLELNAAGLQERLTIFDATDSAIRAVSTSLPRVDRPLRGPLSRLGVINVMDSP